MGIWMGFLLFQMLVKTSARKKNLVTPGSTACMRAQVGSWTHKCIPPIRIKSSIQFVILISFHLFHFVFVLQAICTSLKSVLFPAFCAMFATHISLMHRSCLLC